MHQRDVEKGMTEERLGVSPGVPCNEEKKRKGKIEDPSGGDFSEVFSGSELLSRPQPLKPPRTALKPPRTAYKQLMGCIPPD